MKSYDERTNYTDHFLKLGQGRVISREDRKFWSLFWESPTSSQEINELLSLDVLRKVRNHNTVNYIIFIRVVCAELSRLAQSEHWKDKYDVRILNCIRLLTKALPVLFETGNYQSCLEYLTFWEKDVSAPELSTLIGHGQGHGHEPGRFEQSYSQASLAVTLMQILVDLLFTKGFTVAASQKPGGVSLSVWEPGIGYTASKFTPPTPSLDSNRAEVLKMVIVLCSASLYLPPAEVVSSGNKFLTILVSLTPKVKLLTLVSSLTNLACRSSKGTQEAALFADNIHITEIRHLLVTHAFQLLTLMIAFPVTAQVYFIPDLKPHNLARIYVGRIHKESELLFLATSLVAILRFPTTEAEYGGFSLQKAGKASLWALETTTLMWELTQCNKHFKELIKHKFMAELSVILMYYTFAFRDQASHRNLVRICSYFLLYLTSDLEFMEALLLPMNLTLYESLPSLYKLSITPLTTRDFLVSQICTMLLSYVQPQSYSFRSLPSLLLSTLVETLYNLITPISSQPLKMHNDPSRRLNNPNPNGGISYQASSLVTQVIGHFSKKSFLLEKPYHLNLLALVIRSVCTAAVKYPQSSRMLLFCMLKNEKTYDELWNTVFSFQEVYVKGDAIAKIVEDEEEEEEEEEEANKKGAGAMALNGAAEKDEGEGFEDLILSSNSQVAPRRVPRNNVVEYEDHESKSLTFDIESSLRPSPPAGMTDKAREKTRKDSPIGKVWPGKDSLATILVIIIPHLKVVLNEHWSKDRRFNVDTFDLVRKIEASDFNKMIEEHRNQINYGMLADTPLEQLKFSWSHLSLGWYISLLFGGIYNAENNVKTYVGTNNRLVKNFTKSIASVSKLTSSWTSFLKSETVADNTQSLWVENALTSVNVWEGTEIKLFKLENNAGDGFFSSFNKTLSGQAVPSTPGSLNDMTKRFGELRMSGRSNISPAGSGLSTPVEEQESYFGSRTMRNSVSSLHSLNTLNRIRSNTPRNSISQ
ncbi:uncharacterized protein LODBEIA_P30540 [Lodderomyces beijingensis]|uniref:Protein HID1 n=1 Tax=Lodderomyces beijingensis TaxID=1775926 RepID=A0ABP0ZL12_9ASCO